MAEKMKRPGGELASRPLHFFWIVDCSGSMYGEKIGTVNHAESTWFKGYNEKYFFDKGALFCAISKPLRKLLYLQYLLRYKNTYKELGFIKAYKCMEKGSKEYMKLKGTDKNED